MNNHNDSHEFRPLLVEIEDEPANPLDRTIFWVIVAAFLFFGAWMYLGKVDVVVAARGKVVPVGEVKILQPLNPGVLSRILVKPGDYVTSGQVLIEIDPSTTEPELESMKKTAGQLELEQGRINAGLEEKPFPAMAGVDAAVLRVQREIYESTKERLSKQLRVKEEELHQVGEQLQAAIKNKEQSEYLRDVSAERLKRLESIKDIISRDDFDKAQSEYQKNESDVKVAGHRISELRASSEHVHKEIAFIKEDEKSKLLKELADKKKEHIQLLAAIEKSSYVNARQQIVSPVNGYVNKLFINTIGGVVTPAEKLISIVPADSPLEIQAKVINKDIGFVASGMDASIKVDTFDFQKYGILKGTVKQVAKDSIDDEKLGAVYEVYIHPQQLKIVVDGAETPVTTGMSLTAEINVGKRRIIEFFIYPLIKYLDEGMSVR